MPFKVFLNHFENSSTLLRVNLDYFYRWEENCRRIACSVVLPRLKLWLCFLFEAYFQLLLVYVAQFKQRPN